MYQDSGATPTSTIEYEHGDPLDDGTKASIASICPAFA
jgi:hypothetical protein